MLLRLPNGFLIVPVGLMMIHRIMAESSFRPPFFFYSWSSLFFSAFGCWERGSVDAPR